MPACGHPDLAHFFAALRGCAFSAQLRFVAAMILNIELERAGRTEPFDS
jgi:hypothetical protein